MRRPSVLAGLVLAAAAAAVARRRRSARLARIDVYYDDGAAVTLEAGSPAADRLLAIMREAVSG